jgi:hypothetical protein
LLKGADFQELCHAGGPILLEGVAQEHHQNLEIDMYEVLCDIDEVKTRNFGHETA